MGCEKHFLGGMHDAGLQVPGSSLKSDVRGHLT